MKKHASEIAGFDTFAATVAVKFIHHYHTRFWILFKSRLRAGSYAGGFLAQTANRWNHNTFCWVILYPYT
jgi:hypothetical protein